MTSPFPLSRAMHALFLACATVLDGANPDAGETADANTAPLESCVLRVGFPRIAFATLNENDATAAYRAFISALGRKRGYDIHAEVMVFDSQRALEEAVRSGTIHIIITTSGDLLRSRLRDQVDLEFVPMSGGATHRRILLLARADGRVRRLADVRGRSVLVLRDNHTTIGELWLRTALRGEITGSVDAALANAELVSRPHAAILPVFFGRADACVVDDQTFATTAELNPQLRRELVTISASEPLVESVIAFNRTGWVSPRHRQDLREGLAELHLEPSGQQLLTIFRTDRLVRYEPEYLTSVAELYERAGDLPIPAKAARPAAVAAGGE